MKLHLGCGDKRLPGFIHVDARAMPGIDVVCDLSNGLPMFRDNSTELIYWSHGLEHILRPNTKKVLSELFRVCAPGWSLRVSMPDFDCLVDGYRENKFTYEQTVAAMFGGQEYPQNVHYQGWTFEELEKRLIEAGFIEFRGYDPFKVNPKGFIDYSYTKFADVMISLNVEARKP
jgi:predicted SAM-dependent methyltransferase